jgi:hypothetical protein
VVESPTQVKLNEASAAQVRSLSFEASNKLQRRISLSEVMDALAAVALRDQAAVLQVLAEETFKPTRKARTTKEATTAVTPTATTGTTATTGS